MNIVKLPVETIEVQLVGDRINTPAEVHFDQNALTVRIYDGAGEHHFEFSLVSSIIRLVRRSLVNGETKVTAEVLYDFAQEAPQ